MGVSRAAQELRLAGFGVELASDLAQAAHPPARGSDTLRQADRGQWWPLRPGARGGHCPGEGARPLATYKPVSAGSRPDFTAVTRAW